MAPPVIGLAGPTASGKSALALALAARWPVEIISVDSALVYRGMDIGTAKPSPAERALAPHHLIDIRDPLEPYSAAEFAADARCLIAEITARGRIPLLVGGTMLYFKALIEGLAPMPAADASLRAQIEAEAAARGWPALHAELARVDPATASRLAPNDAQRIQRALEVWRASGRPISAWQADASEKIAEERDFMRLKALISLEPQERGWLHARIAARLDAMFAAGFVAEVQRLRARGDLHGDLPAMRAVGYRQVWAALDTLAPGAVPEGAAMAELRDRAIFATRQLAKRQLTWLRGMAQRTVVACDAPDAQARLIDQVRAALAGGQA